jgi:hypothetical protein
MHEMMYMNPEVDSLAPKNTAYHLPSTGTAHTGTGTNPGFIMPSYLFVFVETDDLDITATVYTKTNIANPAGT